MQTLSGYDPLFKLVKSFFFTIVPYLLGLESLPVHNNTVFIVSIIGCSCVQCINDIFRMSV